MVISHSFSYPHEFLRFMDVNRKQLSDIFGVAERTIYNWQNSKGLPVKLSGKRGTSNVYDTKDCIEWKVQSEIEKLCENPIDGYFNYDTERDRLTHHQANVESLKEQQLASHLLPCDIVVRTWQGMVANIKARLLSMPAKLAPVLLNCSDLQDVEASIKQQVYESLTELSRCGLPREAEQFITSKH